RAIPGDLCHNQQAHRPERTSVSFFTCSRCYPGDMFPSRQVNHRAGPLEPRRMIPMRAQPSLPLLAAALSSALVMGACLGTGDEEGPRGPEGPPGQPGQPGVPGAPALDPDTPLSAMVALAFVDDLGVLDADGNTPTNLADYVKALV